MVREALFLVAMLVGCGGTDSGKRDPLRIAPEGDPPTAAASTPGASGSADYEVHEWGLIRASEGDVLIAGAVAPPRLAPVLTVDKPVLYFHTGAPLHLRRVAVEANGAIVEAWPHPPRTGLASRLEWRNVDILPGAECEITPLPGLTSSACTHLPPGEICEVAGLASVRVPGAPCVRTPDGTDTMLFYRERTRAFTPPLRFERVASQTTHVRVTHEGSVALPGYLIRIRDDFGSVRALAVRPPAPGQSIVVGDDFANATAPDGDDALRADMPAQPGSPEPGRSAIRATMREIGLTEGEVDAFLRSWDSTLFNLGAPPAAVDRRGAATDESGEHAMRESFLYFLPSSECDRVARVQFDPSPRAFHRAFAIWSAIRIRGASH